MIDFAVRPGEHIDQVLARFEMARYDAQSVVFDVPLFRFLTTILFRAIGATPQQIIKFLQPLNNGLPPNQVEYGKLVRTDSKVRSHC